MLQHQDRPENSVYGGQGGTGSGDASSSSLRNRKGDKDGNFNFLPGQDDDAAMITRNIGGGGGDENRNQVRPRNQSPLGRDPPSTLSSSGFHHGSRTLSPLSRLPCWSPLEPLPEIESGDDSYGRVPPDGAEERKMVEDETKRLMMMTDNNERERKMKEAILRGSRGGGALRGGEDEDEDEEELEDDDEWGDSDSDFEFSYRSSGSMSSLNMESGGEGMLMGGWDRIGVGEPKSDHRGGGIDANALNAAEMNLERKCNEITKDPSGSRKSVSRRFLPGGGLQEELKERQGHEDQSSDSDGELPELMDTVWTLRDRERFKAQEMEKHQVQLTMYRRLALIRWVRTLQGRVQEQQDRLQSSFDVILTHRKELLRMGAAAAVTAAPPPTAAVGQS
ncbi:uncharacterized protein LOC130128874 isoform X2 [Lampris incognitus]|nr:uncharacterized protein LOC130128874 isoform X2 [Lampris incognitus]